jgi:four helix bundle protein
MKLAHETLDVYQCSTRFLALAKKVLEQIPRGHAPLVDQLRRASVSILLNIAEGSGKVSSVDKAKFYSIARGSSMECGAALDACQILELSDEAITTEAKELLVRIVSMLSKMCAMGSSKFRKRK